MATRRQLKKRIWETRQGLQARQQSIAGFQSRIDQPYQPPSRPPTQAADPRSQLEAGSASRSYEEQMAELGLGEARLGEDIGTARRLAKGQEVESTRGERRLSNRQGLLFSGVLTKRLGDVRKRYAEEESQRTTSYNRAIQDINTRRAALTAQRDEAIRAAQLAASERAQAAAAEAAANAPAYAPNAPGDVAGLAAAQREAARLQRQLEKRQKKLQRGRTGGRG